MGIKTLSILKDPTTAFTGGTAAPMSFLDEVGGKIRMFFDGTSFLSRSEALFSTREARVKSDAPNGYTQQREDVVVRVPKTLANGNSTFTTLSLSLSSDIEVTDAEKDTILEYGAQLLTHADTQAFWKSQAKG
jgi:hypothetical protein